ncbi:MAG: efflux RND transporter periplasmic adaptor subunit [Pyrinomonadaceae bacterium]
MNEQETEQTREQKIVEGAGAGGSVNETRIEETRTKETRVETPSHKRVPVAIVAVAAVIAIAGLALAFWWWRGGNSDGAGRPVPAPRTVAVDQPGSATTMTGANGATNAEPTLTLDPEQAARAGIKIEPVGEQLAADAGGGQVATGVVQPNAYRETPVVALVGGIVRKIEGELGQNVKRGQTMAVVFSDELSEAQSRYIAAAAELDEHHKHHLRTARLVEIGAASREEFEQATTKLKSAESDVAALRQKLLLLGLSPQRANNLRSPSQISSEVELPSPATGTVTSRSVNPGEVIEANKELLRVTDLSSVWVIGQVYEKDLGRVRTGSGASITSDAYPGKIFRGKISYVDPRLDPQTRTAQVRIELANPGQLLKLGMFVNIAFATIGGAEGVSPAIPTSAVQSINNQQIVFVATSNPNVFILRAVRLAPESSNRFSVLEGLRVGERIVTEGSFLLRAEWLKTHPSQ